MASISKTPSGRWKCRVRFKGASVSQTFTTRKAAVTWGKRKERELEQDRAFGYAESSLRKLTLAELCVGYLEQYGRKDASGIVRGKDPSRPGRVRWWIQVLGAERVLEIDKRQVRDALDMFAKSPATRRTRDGRLKPLKRLHSNASVNRMQATLSAVFEWGKHELDLPSNPCREVKGRREPKNMERFLTREEVAKLLKACRESSWDRLYLLVLMAVNTGARRGELTSLRWLDIDWVNRTVTLKDTKNNENRVLTLSDEVMEELQRIAKSRSGGNVVDMQIHRIQGNLLIFSHERVSVAVAFDHLFAEACERAGLGKVRFHDLRHTAASLLAQSGATLHEIANVLGHKNLQTTQRYAHFCVDSKRKLTDSVLGNLANGGNGDE